ncbi:hypothetical protein ACWD1Y_22760 [Streptomyces sp. NPDC002814]
MTSFACPGQASRPTPSDTRLHVLAPDGDAIAVPALEELADHIAPDTEPVLAPFRCLRCRTAN